MSVPRHKQALVWEPGFDQPVLSDLAPHRRQSAPQAKQRTPPPERCPKRQGGHHWQLPTPNGPKLPSVCKACGKKRVFPTTNEDPTNWLRLNGTPADRSAGNPSPTGES